jgi:hypothetical protein
MLTPTTHKIAIYVAFVLLSAWLLLASLLTSQTVSPYGPSRTAAHEEGEKQLIERRIADYTLALAAFTGMLAVSTIGLWIATAIGFRNQSRETKILQRAYVAVRPRGIDRTDDGKVIGQLAFVNVGSLPARNFRAAVKICWSVDPDLSEFEELPLGEEVVLPAKTKFPSGTGALPKDDAEFFFHASGGHIFVWGKVIYTDGFGTPRWLKFCHRYNVKAPRNSKGGISRRYGRHHHHHNEDDGGIQN